MKQIIFLFSILEVLYFTAPNCMSMLPKFNHCDTAWERKVIANYIPDGEDVDIKQLKDAFINILEFQFNCSVLESGSILSSGTIAFKIIDSIDAILGTVSGQKLLGILITKISLKEAVLKQILLAIKAVACYNNTVETNNDQMEIDNDEMETDNDTFKATPTIKTKYDLLLAFLYTIVIQPDSPTVNDNVYQFTRLTNFSEVLTYLLYESDWELRCNYILGESMHMTEQMFQISQDIIKAVESTPLLKMEQPIDDLISSLTDILLLQLKNIKIKLYNINNQSRHFFIVENQTPCINIDFSYFGIPEYVSCLPINFSSTTPDTADFMNLSTRNINDLDEIFFHELCHCLHWIEPKVNIKNTIELLLQDETDLSSNLLLYWQDADELRTGTGFVLLTDNSFLIDPICTFNYDKERGRCIRWPYKKVPQDSSRFAKIVACQHGF